RVAGPAGDSGAGGELPAIRRWRSLAFRLPGQPPAAGRRRSPFHFHRHADKASEQRPDRQPRRRAVRRASQRAWSISLVAVVLLLELAQALLLLLEPASSFGLLPLLHHLLPLLRHLLDALFPRRVLRQLARARG